MGSKDPVIAPYQSFQAADGYLNVAIGSEKLWTEFCEALGREDLLDDPRFRKNRNRVQHVDELEAELEATFRERAVDEWVADLMDDHGLPVGPVNPVSEALDNDHVEARDLLRDLDHPSVDEFPVVEQPLRFERANAGFEKHAPVLGETTVERLMDLGYTDDEIVALGERGVVGFPEGSVDG
jgi:crotonobetainyl-CoA:carnitine CoA-transferase CaiB-like acyl-CoA transferase